jgi:type I restriction enzyme S subunit
MRLEELCTAQSGGTPRRSETGYYGGSMPWVKIGDLDAPTGIVVDTEEHLTEAGLEAIRGRVFPDGTLLLAMYGSVGKLAFAGRALATNQAILGIQVVRDDLLDSRFLFWWLTSRNGVLQQMAQGVTQKNLSAGQIRGLDVPLPPLPEQRRIAAILDEADALRRTRREALGLLDELLRSTFLEMFGDPVTNPRGWPVVRLGDACTITTGNTPSRDNPDYYGSHIEWIKSDNINTPLHYLTASREGLSEAGQSAGRTAGPGSVLMTCIAGSPACIGNVALADRAVAFNQQINALTPGRLIRSEYLYAALLFGKALVQGKSTDSMKGMVSKGKLAEVRIPIPGLQLQDGWCKVFNQDHWDAASARAALRELDSLFDSLLHRAFSGEL